MLHLGSEHEVLGLLVQFSSMMHATVGGALPGRLPAPCALSGWLTTQLMRAGSCCCEEAAKNAPPASKEAVMVSTCCQPADMAQQG
jgi:hypothetical protein